MKPGMYARLMCAGFLMTGVGLAQAAGWVLEREEKTSPLFEKKKVIANQMSPVEYEQQVVAQAYRKALQDYRARIKPYWPGAEISSKRRWVVYAPDKQAKRVVDFEQQRIEISVMNPQPTNFKALGRRVQKQLEQLISSRIQQSMAEDPINAALQQQFVRLGAVDKALPNELVMSELFTQANPTQQQIRQRARQLMKRARIRYQALTASSGGLPANIRDRITYVMPLPNDRIRRKVKAYESLVKKQGQRLGVESSLIFAMIHTESHFNPMARSHIPALGLMQIVPSTAGRDASKKLFQTSRLLSADYLYDPEKNIEVGAAYLNVLYNQYLKGIKNPESRLYYTIAAYNAGASSLAKAFIGKASFTEATAVINQMKPPQVLTTILNKAPSAETRDYLKKVLKRRNDYRRIAGR